MPLFFFDIGFNEYEIRAKVISRRDGKNKQYAEKKKICSFLHRTGNKILGSRILGSRF